MQWSVEMCNALPVARSWRLDNHTHKAAIIVDEADGLGNVVQPHGNVLLPAEACSSLPDPDVRTEYDGLPQQQQQAHKQGSVLRFLSPGTPLQLPQ